jgi:hypothetical protein
MGHEDHEDHEVRETDAFVQQDCRSTPAMRVGVQRTPTSNGTS